MSRRPIVLRLARALPPDGRFWWAARDLTVTTRDGRAATFTRASAGWSWGAGGAPVAWLAGRPRWQVAPADGALELLLEPAATNRVRTDLGNWTPAGGLAAPTGTVWGHDQLWTVAAGDPATLRLDGTVTGLTVAAPRVSVVVRWPGVSLTSTTMLRDTTASADRGGVTITWGSTPLAPTLSASAGATGLRVTTLDAASGTYRVAWSAAGVVSGNAHRLSLFPSLAGATVWSLPQVEDGALETSPIVGTATSSTRAADALAWGALFRPAPLTLLADWTDYGLTSGGTGGFAQWLAVGGGSDPRLLLQEGAAGQVTAVYSVGGGNYAYAGLGSITFGDRVELVATLPATGGVTLERARNRAAPVSQTTTVVGSVTGIASTWGADTFAVTPLRPLGLRRLGVVEGAARLGALQGP